MYLASAYPNSVVSAGALILLSFVMAGCLALWLGLVFLADRKSTPKQAREADSYLAVVARPPAAEDGQSEAGNSRPSASEQRAVA
jgi:hypothetical protein